MIQNELKTHLILDDEGFKDVVLKDDKQKKKN